MHPTIYRYRLESLKCPVAFAQDMAFIHASLLKANEGKDNIVYSLVKYLCKVYTQDIELRVLGLNDFHDIRISYGLGNTLTLPKDSFLAVFYEVKNYDIPDGRLAII